MLRIFRPTLVAAREELWVSVVQVTYQLTVHSGLPPQILLFLFRLPMLKLCKVLRFGRKNDRNLRPLRRQQPAAPPNPIASPAASAHLRPQTSRGEDDPGG